jgi:hypothetical protein
VKSGAHDMVWLNVLYFTASKQGGGGGKGGEGDWGNKLPISLHYLAQGEGQGGGLRSLPLDSWQKEEGGGRCLPGHTAHR